MDKSKLATDLSALLEELTSLRGPQVQRARNILRNPQIWCKQPHQGEPNLQDLLALLRVFIKYLCFDLEATRRENAVLTKLVEENLDDS